MPLKEHNFKGLLMWRSHLQYRLASPSISMNLWLFSGPVIFSLETSQALNPWLLTLDLCLTGSPRNTCLIQIRCGTGSRFCVIIPSTFLLPLCAGLAAENLEGSGKQCNRACRYQSKWISGIFWCYLNCQSDFILYQSFADGFLEFVIPINMLQIHIYTAFFIPAVTALSVKAVFLSPLISGQVHCFVLPWQSCTGKSPPPV